MSAIAADHFDRGGWWDEACAGFRSLRAVSEFRWQLLQRWLPEGVTGRLVVDLGAGGGLLAVPLAAAGARVVALDLAGAALRECRMRGGERLHAVVADMTAPPLRDGAADLVLLADTLEHVADPAAAVGAAARLLKPGGLLFVNTISRTLRSRWLAITLAEGLGYVPRGTHRWRDFVRPEELERLATGHGLQREQRVGEVPRLLATLRSGAIRLRESRNLAVGYAALYRRLS